MICGKYSQPRWLGKETAPSAGEAEVSEEEAKEEKSDGEKEEDQDWLWLCQMVEQSCEQDPKRIIRKKKKKKKQDWGSNLGFSLGLMLV